MSETERSLSSPILFVFILVPLLLFGAGIVLYTADESGPAPQIASEPERPAEPARDPAIVTGMATLPTGYWFSFRDQAVVNWEADLTFDGERAKAKYGLYEVGRVRLESVHSVYPAQPNLIRWLSRFTGDYLLSSRIFDGRTYAILLGRDGPFAAFEVLSFDRIPQTSEPYTVTFRYKVQPNGTNRF